MEEVAAASRDLIGREDELAAIERLLADPVASPAALVLDGEAGIGKTTVWLEGLEIAAGHGFRVLSCRPAEAETSLPFAALGDLFEGALDDVLPVLPEAQRAPLETALLMSASSKATDRLAVSRATLAVVRELARMQPLLVAVDDIQWLDAATASMLEFAARRLEGLPVRLLLARRSERDLPPPLALAQALPPSRLEVRRVGPLGLSALHEVVHRQLDVVVPRPTLLRVHEISAGNPFYAVELVRSLPARAGRIATAELGLPPGLVELVGDRLGSLPAATIEIVAAAGALGDPTLLVLRGYADDAAERLRPAEEAGIVRLVNERVRFEHPLLASGSLALLTDAQRRRLHLRLADVGLDLEERALHLALGSDGPAEETALLLEEASKRAADRGAPMTAAELAEHAAQLTPRSDAVGASRRRRLAASHYIVAGEIDRGRRILERLEHELPPGPARAAALLLLADTGENIAMSLDLSERARAEALGDDECLAEAWRQSAEFTMLAGHNLEALELAREAASIAGRTDDPVLLLRCLGTQSHYETYTGEITPGSLERAVALEQRTAGASSHYSPTQILGLRLMYGDRLDDARPLLEGIAQQTEERGDELERSNLYVHLTQLEIRAGRWAAAKRHADLAYELDRQLGIRSDSRLFLRAFVAAHLGNVADAREAGARSLALQHGAYPLWALMTRWALGLLELSLGDAAAAAEHLAPLPEALLRAGYRNPGVRPVLPDAIEALIGVGRTEEAERWVCELAERGRELDNPWAIATAARCAGLVSASRGDIEGAREQLIAALSQHERSPNPFERARTMLVLGTVERRVKQRTVARETLGRALEIFDALGAPLWAERAAAELERVPGRRKADELALSPTERRIAELVANGLANKEVAAALFVSVRTVEANLSKIYVKLGIRSRSELAGRLNEESSERAV
jgi:DNA-binding CsgD family transcriptional regulator